MRTHTNDPDELSPTKVGLQAHQRRRFRVRLPESRWPDTLFGRPDPMLGTGDRWSVNRSVALAALAHVRVACACGWSGGYADMEPRHHRCPRCRSVAKLDRLEGPPSREAS